MLSIYETQHVLYALAHYLSDDQLRNLCDAVCDYDTDDTDDPRDRKLIEDALIQVCNERNL